MSDPRNDPRLHPLAGKIKTGVRTTEDRAATAVTSLPLLSMPKVTMQDKAHQMFGMSDKKGTRVYYVEGELPFNTVDTMGNAITFIAGLYKTNNKSICNYLQEYVDSRKIKYLELEADPYEHSEGTEGSSSDASQSNEQDKQEPSYGGEPAPAPDRQGPGGEGTSPAELPQPGSTLSSSSGAGDDGESENVAATASLKDKLGVKG